MGDLNALKRSAQNYVKNLIMIQRRIHVDLYASRFTHLNAHTVKCLVPSVLNTTDMLAIVRNWVTASSQTLVLNHVLQFIQQSARIVLNLDQNVSPKNALTYATNLDTILNQILVSDHAP